MTRSNGKVTTTKTGRPVKHGKWATYHKHKCRCGPCTVAWRDYHREWLHRRGLVRPRDVVNAERRAAVQHGSHTMYVHYRCRCDVCREGARVRRANERAKAKARAS